MLTCHVSVSDMTLLGLKRVSSSLPPDKKLFFSSLGIGIGVVDVGYERRLANHLGAHQTPSILGVVNGKVAFFHYAVVKGHLMQFVEDLLPQRLVEKVSEHHHALLMSVFMSSSGLKLLVHGCM